MCGRFTQNYTWEQVHAFLSVFGPPRNLQPHNNIAPTNTVDVIRLDKEGKRELVPMRWGLVHAWWKKSLKEVPAMFNARAESVADKPMFRTAFKERRCIVPASGFFEWTGEKGAKQPHSPRPTARLCSLSPGSGTARKTPSSANGCWSCTIIVAGASAWMEPYHDRMPVLLEAKDFDAWLAGSLGPEALKPAPEEILREWKVSPRSTAPVWVTMIRPLLSRCARLAECCEIQDFCT